jgi:hypothetical protein
MTIKMALPFWDMFFLRRCSLAPLWGIVLKPNLMTLTAAHEGWGLRKMENCYPKRTAQKLALWGEKSKRIVE